MIYRFYYEMFLWTVASTNSYICFVSKQERHKALEEMGISVQSSGIAVEKGKFYLVNLNADPSMNELLVYYLKVKENVTVYSLKSSDIFISSDVFGKPFGKFSKSF